MESCVIAGSSNLEPQDDMEFDSNEAAYDFYKEYAKSVGFGTAKLSSRRSRASKEFIDAKFSCIRYGSKQQSDDAINPRPSPKIGCKASMHVKRRPTGKWYIHSMVKEHNHDLLPAQAHFFRSHRSIDPLKNDAKVRRRKILAAVSKQYGAYQYTEQFEKRWWKLIAKFNLREDEWFQSLYTDRKFWVPTFIRDISFAGLSTASRSESLNSFFDKYVHSESSLKDFVEQYKAVLQDRYEEQAKADFDAWHETPELKSPSPFEKQMSLVYTHEIFKKFQVEVLGAAACHLKKEREDESTVIYSVKDFEDNQDFSVEWNESKSEIGCSCCSFEYKGYLCRHAVVVLQMSGVFSIPFRYILQRWTNAATSRHSISERVDEVQSKVRRYNDLCRRAIILGEEGSLSQESYHIALGAIKDALKQCSDVNNSTENVLRPDIMVPLTTLDVEEEHQARTITAKEQVPSFIMNKTGKASKRMGSVKEKPSDDNDANKKGKVPVEPEILGAGIPGGFQQMDLLQVRPIHLHDAVPPNVQNVVPTMFHNVPSTQFHHAASTNMQDAHLPR
ncbi:hypothetical protein RJ640_014566 [Escallonia rubra]|uniref:Protein FAR1-RELATED SEQUENCE n=1 Tax=Escallonia rubra TaxID=112253 RepID=A0AA88R6U1_9ASTE|nr:hypothetical protein RJ640_014566 [Escallonia rubra]